MRYSTQVKPISYVKANAAEILLDLAERQEPMIITQNGEAKARVDGHCVIRGNAGHVGAAEASGFG